MSLPVPAERFDALRLEQSLRSGFELGGHEDLFIAFSGGLDSTVLLHALVAIDSIQNSRITALHLNHGLNENADTWEQSCGVQCRAWNVHFVSHRVDAVDRNGHGTEAAARALRYQWFSREMTKGSVLITAHHFNDHVETILARLFRGAGVRGLAGIRPSRPFANGELWRPLLGVSRAALAEYAAENQLAWIEDPMNAESRFTRSHLRHNVLPVIRERWHGVDQVIARSADNCLDASELLDEIADQDLGSTWHGTEGGNHVLSITDLRRYSRHRMANVLRRWFLQCGFKTPSRQHLHDVLASLVDGCPSPTSLLSWPGTDIRRYRDRLYLSEPARRGVIDTLVWDRSRMEPVMINGRELFTREVTGRGISKTVFDSGTISVRPRVGGEICRLPGNDCSKKLKKIFQEKGIPPWQRDDFPMLYVGDALAGVAGICYCQPYAAEPNEPGVEFELADGVGISKKGEDLFP